MSASIITSFEQINEKIVIHFNKNIGNLLNEAKDFFSSFINSNRQLNKVHNIEQLLKLLQRRGIYNAYEFTGLRIFQKIILDDEFNALVKAHQSMLSTSQELLSNIYALKRRNIQLQSGSQYENANQIHQNFQIPIEKQNEIFNAIADKFSPRDVLRLGRVLDFSERDLKEIEERCSDCHTRTIVLLGHYKERKNSLKKLLGALELIGKIDIKHEIKSIIE
ncbi:hypothetical protein PVAND_011797 [Polypedilum vanderplanki]|uniref:Death domain-containing protein n=1 Tax=Polypedilum vanderplanki TaxID=319348 RepID=A0A9J6CKG8_POLVA|nr:hypothetical protein PVAND_011797 [Polypedilum vanderplanki]